MTWQERARCRDADPALFFPTSRCPNEYAAARALCAACDVLDECLAEALREETGLGAARRYGMRGGMTPSARARLAGTTVALRCAECGRQFSTSTGERLCSGVCRALYTSRYNREYQRAHRNNGRTNPIASHGTVTMAKSGCKCFACKNRRAGMRRAARLRARAKVNA